MNEYRFFGYMVDLHGDFSAVARWDGVQEKRQTLFFRIQTTPYLMNELAGTRVLKFLHCFDASNRSFHNKQA